MNTIASHSIRRTIFEWASTQPGCSMDPRKERENLWNFSKPADHFDIFLSHTWLTPGRLGDSNDQTAKELEKDTELSRCLFLEKWTSLLLAFFGSLFFVQHPRLRRLRLEEEGDLIALPDRLEIRFLLLACWDWPCRVLDALGALAVVLHAAGIFVSFCFCFIC